jgi:hypothetical protein
MSLLQILVDYRSMLDSILPKMLMIVKYFKILFTCSASDYIFVTKSNSQKVGYF